MVPRKEKWLWCEVLQQNAALMDSRRRPARGEFRNSFLSRHATVVPVVEEWTNSRQDSWRVAPTTTVEDKTAELGAVLALYFQLQGSAVSLSRKRTKRKYMRALCARRKKHGDYFHLVRQLALEDREISFQYSPDVTKACGGSSTCWPAFTPLSDTQDPYWSKKAAILSRTVEYDNLLLSTVMSASYCSVSWVFVRHAQALNSAQLLMMRDSRTTKQHDVLRPNKVAHVARHVATSGRSLVAEVWIGLYALSLPGIPVPAAFTPPSLFTPETVVHAWFTT